MQQKQQQPWQKQSKSKSIGNGKSNSGSDTSERLTPVTHLRGSVETAREKLDELRMHRLHWGTNLIGLAISEIIKNVHTPTLPN